MIKLVKGRDNVIDLNIVATYPVGEVYGKFIAKSVEITIPKSRYGTTFTVSASDVNSIGEGFMYAEVTLNASNSGDSETKILRVPMEVLPAGSSNGGFTTIRCTLVSIKEVKGGGHGGGSGVLMYETFSAFPIPGDPEYLYLAKDTDTLYRWREGAEDYVVVGGDVKESSFATITPLSNATIRQIESQSNLILGTLKGE